MKISKDIFSWTIASADLKIQIEKYRSLGIKRSFRGVLILVMSAFFIVSLFLSFMRGHYWIDSDSFIANLLSPFMGYTSLPTIIWWSAIFFPIIFFIYKGHRWAIVLLLLAWTLARGHQFYFHGSIVKGVYHITSVEIYMAVIIGWYMALPYFFKALKVENERRKKNISSFDKSLIFCRQCGARYETDAKFCSGCGANIQSK